MKFKNACKLSAILFISLLITTNVSSQEGKGQGRINGMIQDEAGNPVKNAQIKATSLPKEDISFEATSNEKGEWAILGLGTGMWRVIAAAEGYYPAYQDLSVKQLERNPDVNFTLKKIPLSDMPFITDEATFALFEQGNLLFTEKKYDEAISSFKQFLEKNPKAFQVHINIGNCYKEKGELDKAIEEFNMVLEGVKQAEQDISSDEITAKALAAIGEVYLKKEDFENAQKYFKNSIEIYPKDEALAYNVGEIYFSNNKIDEAIHFFELSSQIKPDWERPYLKLGYAYLNKGDFQAAKENFKKFIEMAPESSQAPSVRNIIEYLDKQIKEPLTQL